MGCSLRTAVRCYTITPSSPRADAGCPQHAVRCPQHAVGCPQHAVGCPLSLAPSLRGPPAPFPAAAHLGAVCARRPRRCRAGVTQPRLYNAGRAPSPAPLRRTAPAGSAGPAAPHRTMRSLRGAPPVLLLPPLLLLLLLLAAGHGAVITGVSAAARHRRHRRDPAPAPGGLGRAGAAGQGELRRGDGSRGLSAGSDSGTGGTSRDERGALCPKGCPERGNRSAVRDARGCSLCASTADSRGLSAISNARTEQCPAR